MLFGPEHALENLLQSGWSRRPRRRELMVRLVHALPITCVALTFGGANLWLTFDPFQAFGHVQLVLNFATFAGSLWVGMRLGLLLQRLVAYQLNRRMLRQNEDLRVQIHVLRREGLTPRQIRDTLQRAPFGI